MKEWVIKHWVIKHGAIKHQRINTKVGQPSRERINLHCDGQPRIRQSHKWVFTLPLTLTVTLALLINLLISANLAAKAFTVPAELAQGEGKSPTMNSTLASPQLIFTHPDPQFNAAVPLDTQVHVEVNGLLAHLEVKQVFINPHSIALDGQYQFPLPEDGAVHYLHISDR